MRVVGGSGEEAGKEKELTLVAMCTVRLSRFKPPNNSTELVLHALHNYPGTQFNLGSKSVQLPSSFHYIMLIQSFYGLCLHSS